MNIQLNNIDEVSATLTVKVEQSDYQEKVDKSLKTLRQKANIPGFRPGMVPMGLIKRQYGTAVKVEEINKMLQDKIYSYIRDNKIDMLGEPLPDEEKQQSLDFEMMNEFEFSFTLALAPKFDATLSKKDEIPYYNIEPSEQMIDSQVKMYAQRAGDYKKVDSYEENDMIKGTVVELDVAGAQLEGGVRVEGVVLMPGYMKNEEEKAKFTSATSDSVITFNPRKAYEGNDVEIASLLKKKKEEVASINSDFSFQITEITRFQEGEMNQDLFDQVYGKDVVKSEAEFRAKIKEELQARFAVESDYRLLLDLRLYLKNRVGTLHYPDELLKRILKQNSEEQGEAYDEAKYGRSIEELTWHLEKEQLVNQFGVKIEEVDVMEVAREATRAQFAQYGMMNVPDDLLDNYAKEMLKKKESQEGLVNRAVEVKLTKAVKEAVTLVSKTISAEEFNKLPGVEGEEKAEEKAE